MDARRALGDGEAETGARHVERARRVAALEGAQNALGIADAVAAVEHLHHRAPVLAPHGDLGLARVPLRVADEVLDRPLDEQRVAGHGDGLAPTFEGRRMGICDR